MTARSLALDVLMKCEKSDQYSNLALDAARKRSGLSEPDLALTTTLVYGVLERKLTLDAWISVLSERDPETLDTKVRMLLRMGLYQLAYLDRIPDHAAVNESVTLAGKRAGGFVNAILRGFIRRGKRLPLPERKDDPVRYLSVCYSVGEPLCRRMCGIFGEDRAESLFDAFRVQPPLTVRVNTLKTDAETLRKAFLEKGYRAEPAKMCRNGIRISGHAPVSVLPGFAEGLFFVQDEASQLCVEALDVRPGMRVLDTCSCPGSKSFGAALNMRNEGVLIACDLHESKLPLITSGAERLGLSVLRTFARDARTPFPEWCTEQGQFDRILCDVPCSGFGVIAKKPELRYKDPAVSDGLPDIQLAILERSAEFLKPGGKLVYSTCTVFPCENGENVSRFLFSHPEFELLSERTLFPDTDGTDGFFIAVMKKH